MGDGDADVFHAVIRDSLDAVYEVRYEIQALALDVAVEVVDGDILHIG